MNYALFAIFAGVFWIIAVKSIIDAKYILDEAPTIATKLLMAVCFLVFLFIFAFATISFGPKLTFEFQFPQNTSSSFGGYLGSIVAYIFVTIVISILVGGMLIVVLGNIFALVLYALKRAYTQHPLLSHDYSDAIMFLFRPVFLGLFYAMILYIFSA